MICSGSGRSGGSGGSGRSAKWTAVEMSSIGVVVGANGCGHEATLNRQSTGSTGAKRQNSNFLHSN